MYTATFYMSRQKCKFYFFQVRCAHKSGDVVNFTTVVCRISLRLKWYKNYKNRLRLPKVIVKNILPRFFWFTVYLRNALNIVEADSVQLYKEKRFTLRAVMLEACRFNRKYNFSIHICSKCAKWTMPQNDFCGFRRVISLIWLLTHCFTPLIFFVFVVATTVFIKLN